MKKSTQELIMAFLFILVCVGFLVASFQYGERARLVPVPVAIISIALVLIDLFFERVLKRRVAVNADDIFIRNETAAAECKPGQAVKQSGHKEWQALLIVALMLVLVLLFGIIGGIFLFVFGVFKFVNRTNVFASAIWSVCVTGAVYLVFGLALKVVFYKGFLAAAFG